MQECPRCGAEMEISEPGMFSDSCLSCPSCGWEEDYRIEDTDLEEEYGY